ncbi:MAG TPA: hypothetical protein PLU71_02585 [Candidatus Dependentiae bacterium]|nr:hypothetical protein [Candidatus Dependentiae bacterium]HRQ62717.1 hypothetical protein [Candidatus Dependentiae bacterium]
MKQLLFIFPFIIPISMFGMLRQTFLKSPSRYVIARRPLLSCLHPLLLKEVIQEHKFKDDLINTIKEYSGTTLSDKEIEPIKQHIRKILDKKHTHSNLIRPE